MLETASVSCWEKQVTPLGQEPEIQHPTGKNRDAYALGHFRPRYGGMWLSSREERGRVFRGVRL